MENPTIKVLLVEDDARFVRLLQQSLVVSTHLPDHFKRRGGLAREVRPLRSGCSWPARAGCLTALESLVAEPQGSDVIVVVSERRLSGWNQ